MNCEPRINGNRSRDYINYSIIFMCEHIPMPSCFNWVMWSEIRLDNKTRPRNILFLGLCFLFSSFISDFMIYISIHSSFLFAICVFYSYLLYSFLSFFLPLSFIPSPYRHTLFFRLGLSFFALFFLLCRSL